MQRAESNSASKRRRRRSWKWAVNHQERSELRVHPSSGGWFCVAPPRPHPCHRERASGLSTEKESVLCPSGSSRQDPNLNYGIQKCPCSLSQEPWNLFSSCLCSCGWCVCPFPGCGPRWLKEKGQARGCVSEDLVPYIANLCPRRVAGLDDSALSGRGCSHTCLKTKTVLGIHFSVSIEFSTKQRSAN